MRFRGKVILFSVAALSSLQAEASPRMLFNCHGQEGGLAVEVSVNNYQNGEIRGIHIRRRGLYDTYHDQIVDTDSTFQKRAYNPRNSRYEGLEKYVVETEADRSMVKKLFDWETGEEVDSFDYSEYEFMLPPRSELEKIWPSLDSDRPFKDGEFNNAYLSMRYSNGDNHLLMRLNCSLGWRPSGN